MPKRARHQETLPARQSARLRQKQQQQQQQSSSDAIDAKPSPLAIPEIMQLIGDYLDTLSITICLRVSRSWNQAFLHRIWRNVRIALHQYDGSLFAYLDKNSDLIRRLVTTAPNSRIEFLNGNHLHCRQLSQLDVNGSNTNEPVLSEQNFVDLIKTHQPTLRRVSYMPAASEDLLDAVQGCSHLQQLKIRLPSQTWDSFDRWRNRFDSLWSRVKILIMSGTGTPLAESATPNISEMATLLANTGSTLIQELELSTERYQRPMLQAHLLLILKSPDLACLTWVTKDEMQNPQDVVALLAEAVRQEMNFGQKLAKISLPFAEFANQDFKDLIQSLFALTRIDLLYSNFDAGSWRVLQVDVPRFLTTLKELDVRFCRQVTGAMVHSILCSVLTLEVLCADVITDRDIDEQPWICNRLKLLSLPFLLYLDASQPKVFARLARFEYLETLSMGVYSIRCHLNQIMIDSGDWKKHCLQLSLEHGLDSLRSLRRLRFLKGSNCKRTVWRESEARWVLQNWVSLRHLEGVELDSEAKKILTARINVLTFCLDF
ncbi:hypothetical protein BGZ83_004081 [Gryganskiella cystojenkinii]|nr:hypothetical protein BGZ83_004081 [Gryganskiella cystojenkinii]